MPNAFYNRLTDLAAGDLARAADINAELNAIEAAFDSLNLSVNLGIGLPETFPGNRTIPAQTYINKVVWIDGSGNLGLYEFANLAQYEAAASQAAASAAQAELWADQAEDVEVEAGKYSAKHWAIKAETAVGNSASLVSFAPSGSLAATNVQLALQELDAEKASVGSIVGKLDAENPVMAGGFTQSLYQHSVTAGAVDLIPSNGTTQNITLTGDVTFTSLIDNGQGIRLMIDDGTSDWVVTFPGGVVWKTDAGFPPALNSSGWTIVDLWKAANTLFGAKVGDA